MFHIHFIKIFLICHLSSLPKKIQFYSWLRPYHTKAEQCWLCSSGTTGMPSPLWLAPWLVRITSPTSSETWPISRVISKQWHLIFFSYMLHIKLYETDLWPCLPNFGYLFLLQVQFWYPICDKNLITNWQCDKARAGAPEGIWYQSHPSVCFKVSEEPCMATLIGLLTMNVTLHLFPQRWSWQDFSACQRYGTHH